MNSDKPSLAEIKARLNQSSINRDMDLRRDLAAAVEMVEAISPHFKKAKETSDADRITAMHGLICQLMQQCVPLFHSAQLVVDASKAIQANLDVHAPPSIARLRGIESKVCQLVDSHEKLVTYVAARDKCSHSDWMVLSRKLDRIISDSAAKNKQKKTKRRTIKPKKR